MYPLLQTHRKVSFSAIQTLLGTHEACPLTQGSSVSAVYQNNVPDVKG